MSDDRIREAIVSRATPGPWCIYPETDGTEICAVDQVPGRPGALDGKWLVHTGRVVMCESGLHASRRPWHALQYAPGAILCRVECDSIVAEHTDKLVCWRRKIIERIDVTETLRYFARMQAVSVVHLWDPREVVLDYLMTGDTSLRAAANAAAKDTAGAEFDALIYEQFELA